MDLDRAVDRVKHAREFRKHAISRCVRDPAPMPPDLLVDECTTGGQHCHCRFFIAVHQPAVAFDIRGENCRETSLDWRRFHPASLYFTFSQPNAIKR